MMKFVYELNGKGKIALDKLKSSDLGGLHWGTLPPLLKPCSASKLTEKTQDALPVPIKFNGRHVAYDCG